MKAHLIDTHFKVICKGQGQISGSCFLKGWVFRKALVFHKHILFSQGINPFPNDKFSEMKEFADDNLEFDQHG